MMLGILCLVLAYIAGSFPSGLVIGKALYHTDIRDYGSHNTGATNAYRVLGAVGGLLVLICDVAKGMLGVYLGQVASQSGLGSTDTQIYFMIAGGCWPSSAIRARFSSSSKAAKASPRAWASSCSWPRGKRLSSSASGPSSSP